MTSPRAPGAQPSPPMYWEGPPPRGTTPCRSRVGGPKVAAWLTRFIHASTWHIRFGWFRVATVSSRSPCGPVEGTDPRPAFCRPRMSTLVTQEMNGAGPAPIGRHLAEWRTRRNLTVADLARRSGLPEQLIASLESGTDWVDRRHVLNSLATGLRLDPAELTSQPYTPCGADHATVHATAWHVRRHLTRLFAGELAQDHVRADTEQLAGLLEAVRTADDGGDLVTAASEVPRLLELIGPLVQHPGDNEGAALRSAGYTAVARLLRRIGYRDLAWSALHQARPAEEGFTLVMVEEVRLLLDMGQPAIAVTRAVGTGAALPFEVLLPLSLAHACLGQEAQSERLLEAAEEMVPGPEEASAVASARAFAAAERGAFDQVLGHALDADRLPASDRAGLLVLTASARARLHRFAEAVTDLATAESVAPLHTRLNPLARELVSVLSSRAENHADVVGGIAARCGMT
ncbi:helix-turn-helix transcriptional regulator [Streptomyces sp. NPDC006134]|uniref:helix-turn-helix domain-containing protein n=1 Tax=Streptomyces sp. NPDC006134 TaxID=3154467 RepID=UPI0033C539D2